MGAVNVKLWGIFVEWFILKSVAIANLWVVKSGFPQ